MYTERERERERERQIERGRDVIYSDLTCGRVKI
jgi:hypothetical protein